MKRLPWILIALIPCMLHGGSDKTRSFTDRVTAGSLTVTNSEQSAAYELKNVTFTIPTAAFTNAFSIQHIRTYKLPDIRVSNVTTSEVISPLTGSGAVETNVQRYAQGAVTFTNSITVVTTTNDANTQAYDTDDFPKGWSWEYEDVQIFSFTETNSLNLIRVYDVYQRP